MCLELFWNNYWLATHVRACFMKGFGLSLAKCGLLGNSSPKPWFNALAQGVSKRPGPMAFGAMAIAAANASGKGCSGTCSNDRYLEPKCATVGCVRRSTTTSRWCGPYYCKDYEGRPMKAPPEAYGGAWMLPGHTAVARQLALPAWTVVSEILNASCRLGSRVRKAQR